MSSDNPHAPLDWPDAAPRIPQRVGAMWSATTTLAFIRDEVSGKALLHQLWIDDLGLTEWRQVPMINRGDPVRRNPAVVGVAPPDEESA